MIDQILWFTRFGDDFQITDTCPNGHSQLVRVNQAVKVNACALSPSGLDQEIVVLREEHTPEYAGAIE
ncbi:MAG TPA: hypothetical protein VJ793_16185 [Anaerolineae bacterium]|nr:hypothetical protein [Anaerolineae bacterium]